MLFNDLLDAAWISVGKISTVVTVFPIGIIPLAEVFISCMSGAAELGRNGSF